MYDMSRIVLRDGARFCIRDRRAWDRRDKLDDLLRTDARSPRHAPHHVHARLQVEALSFHVIAIGHRPRRCAPIPSASNMLSRDDLCEPPGLGVPDLDEARVEEQHVRRVVRRALRRALPFDHRHSARRVPVPIDVQPKLCAAAISGPAHAGKTPSTYRCSTAGTRRRSSGTCPAGGTSRSASRASRGAGHRAPGSSRS
jgi:hypothetical protein